MRQLKLAGLSGSLRRNSHNTAILRTLQERLANDIALSLLPLDGLPLYNGDLEGPELPAAVAEFRAALEAADGLVVCSPEYNAGTSGVLKNALDWASRPANASPLKGKHVLLMSSSPGFMGGVRAQAQLREGFASTLSRVLVHPSVVVAGVHQKIQEGRFVDESNIQFALDAIAALASEIQRDPAR
ncbi:NADPH-dependent FMN reductase [Aquabacterium sp.]|uniref:NADPH-dependent FMN reductase n=1 Tax=Aquabacterium sp. TaxID=1872578 RepID=UPI002BCFB304|nr:NADPH-dependent FMN reductase [Aquabacterium sp.]HSW04491.1 NADPH-dependent FMN reductase [Aquabacterium sp.]